MTHDPRLPKAAKNFFSLTSMLFFNAKGSSAACLAIYTAEVACAAGAKIESRGHSIVMQLVLIIGLVLFVDAVRPLFGAEAGLVPKKPVPALDLFAEGKIPRLRLELSDDAMEQLRKSPRKYVSGAVVEGDRRYTNVAIRLKGGPGSFRPLDDRPAFTINFDRMAPGQTFHGLKKLHLNNSVQDSSYLAEKLCREMFEAAGVPAPRAGSCAGVTEPAAAGPACAHRGGEQAVLETVFRGDGWESV